MDTSPKIPDFQPMKPVIEPQELHDRMQRETVVILDVRASLADHDFGRKAFAAGHLPGARFFDLEKDLSGSKTSVSGRHPLPQREDLYAKLEACGVSDDTLVVAYDQNSSLFAARMWWLAVWLGHPRAAVLNGGLDQWLAQGFATEQSEQPLPSPGKIPRHPEEPLVVSLAEVRGMLDNPSVTLVDARAPERFRGEVEPLDKIPGHVPGAVNHPLALNLGADGRFLPPEKLRALHGGYFVGIDGEQRVIHMCGSGVTACHNILASQLAGLPLPQLYAGSWSEWSRDPDSPVATGA